MNIKWVIIFILIFSFWVRIDNLYAKGPKWMVDPQLGCKKHELCVVGVGPGLNMATSDARASIAKVFKTKIEAKFSQSMSSDNSGNDDISLSENINESSNETIEGIEIKEVYEGDQDIFVHAVLDKRKYASIIKKDIKRIDEKMKTYFKEDTASSINQVKSLLPSREKLARKYEFLTGRSVKSDITFEQIMKKRRDAMSGIVLLLQIVDREGEIKSLVKESLLGMGYRIVNTKGKMNDMSWTHMVSGDFSHMKISMNVEGWEKYKFILNLVATKKAGVSSGMITFSETIMSRSLEDANVKVRAKVVEYLRSNIGDLIIQK